jgi:hypothetical protein
MRQLIAVAAASLFAMSLASAASACMGSKMVQTSSPITTAEAPITPAPTHTPKTGG